MNQGPRWILLMKKTRVVKSRAIVPLKTKNQLCYVLVTVTCQYSLHHTRTISYVLKITDDTILPVSLVPATYAPLYNLSPT